MLDGAGVAIEAVWWRSDARAPGVLLLHPYDGDADSVAPMAVALQDAGYHAISMSMRGFGRSGGADDCGLRQPDDVVAVLGWMGARDEIVRDRLALYGRSQGGMVALLAAARTLTPVRAVVVWNPVTDLDHWRANTQHPLIPAYID